MKSPLFRFAISMVRAWTRLYTWRMPRELREERRAEIESDLWEFGQDAVRNCGLASAGHMFVRLLSGMPDDLRWRVENVGLRGRSRRTAVALSTAAAVVVFAALWIFITLQPATLPPPPPRIVFTASPPPPRVPPPPPPPPRYARSPRGAPALPPPQPSRRGSGSHAGSVD
jgi:hypothetical protein